MTNNILFFCYHISASSSQEEKRFDQSCRENQNTLTADYNMENARAGYMGIQTRTQVCNTYTFSTATLAERTRLKFHYTYFDVSVFIVWQPV